MRTDLRGGVRRGLTAVAVVVAALVPAACGGGSEEAVSRQDVVAHYAEGVEASYRATLASARRMDSAVDAFIADPTPAALAAARRAWLAARDDYGLTEAFRFYGGPIDNEATGREGRINAWPLDEAYIDYVAGSPAAGIINDPAGHPRISARTIAELNEKGGETNISTGWHAIEFLLWGQDRSRTGAGERTVDDYTTAPNARRRAAYLAAASDLLVTDLQDLVEEWAPGEAGGYRARFEADPDVALRNMLVGMGELSRGELAGERMNVAYSERSEEDEHSCFSDNTTSDLVANAKGIRMVYTGEYPGASGPGLSALVAEEDPHLDTRLREALDASVARIEAIPAPFDQHLREGVPDSDPGRRAVLASIVALEDQAELVVDAGSALGVAVNLS